LGRQKVHWARRREKTISQKKPSNLKKIGKKTFDCLKQRKKRETKSNSDSTSTKKTMEERGRRNAVQKEKNSKTGPISKDKKKKKKAVGGNEDHSRKGKVAEGKIKYFYENGKDVFRRHLRGRKKKENSEA